MKKNKALTELITRICVAIPLLSFFLTMFFWCNPVITTIFLASCLVYIICVEWPPIARYHRGQLWYLTPLYPVLPFLILIALNQGSAHRWLLVCMVLLVVSYDTGAYLIGSAIGKTKLAPTISPQKTWEGCIGGYVFASATAYFLNKLYQLNFTIASLLIATACICVAAQLGDLFESILKRKVGIKHSGSLLAAHGGLLDRFDSLLSTGLLFYFFKYTIS